MITPVILCGGSGARLWPATAELKPKPFIPLVAGESTFAAALSRVADPAIFAEPVIVAEARHAGLVAAALKAGRREAMVLLEPEGRDSAPAVAAAATMVAAGDPALALLVLQADHFVPDSAGFVAAARAGLPAAEAGRIVLFGVTPTYPARGFAYLRPGEPSVWPGIRGVARLVERPGASETGSFLAEGWLWNSGNLLMRADVALSELVRHGGQVASVAARALAEATVKDGMWHLGAAYADAPAVSFAEAVIARSDRKSVVAAAFTWSDLGTWDAVLAASPRDVSGNAAVGIVALRDVRRSYVRSESVPVGVIGLDDIVVVATDQGVLVASRGRGDGVRQIAASLQVATLDRDASAATPAGAGFSVRTLGAAPGDPPVTSRAAGTRHWLIAEGSAKVAFAGIERIASAGTGMMIPGGEAVSLAAAGVTPVAIVETTWREDGI